MAHLTDCDTLSEFNFDRESDPTYSRNRDFHKPKCPFHCFVPTGRIAFRLTRPNRSSSWSPIISPPLFTSPSLRNSRRGSPRLTRRGCCSWCSILSSFKGRLVSEFFSYGNIRFRLVCAPSRHFKGRNHSWMNDFVEGNAIFGRVKSAESPDFTRQVEVANSFLYYWSLTWDSNRCQFLPHRRYI